MEKGRRWLSQFYLREKERIGGRGETRKMMVDTNEFTGEFEKKIKHRSKDTTSTLHHRTPQKTYVITRF